MINKISILLIFAILTIGSCLAMNKEYIQTDFSIGEMNKYMSIEFSNGILEKSVIFSETDIVYRGEVNAMAKYEHVSEIRYQVLEDNGEGKLFIEYKPKTDMQSKTIGEIDSECWMALSGLLKEWGHGELMSGE